MTRLTIKALLAENESLRRQLALLKRETGCIDLIEAYTLLFAEQVQTGKKVIGNASPSPMPADDWD